jgi:hypothetical protein
MSVRTCSALLFLLSACATPEPRTKPRTLNQAVLPLPPLVEPIPMVMPAPMGLTPPAIIMVDPRGQMRQAHPEAEASSEATRPVPRTHSAGQEEASADPVPAPGGASSHRGPPPLLMPNRRPECEPIPKPHLGGDAFHDLCSDNVPLNDFRGFDAYVNTKRFDAVQLSRRVLWEIKTDRFETYSVFLRRQVIDNQIPELQRERELARACGYAFWVGVKSAAHKAALLDRERDLNIVVMEWC